jgi:methylglyoxal synthase
MEAAPCIALIAHDGKKDALIAFVQAHRTWFEQFRLVATGTTGARLAEATGLGVECLASGPLGGDAQIAARITEGTVHAVVFFRDPMDRHPHEPDINMLLRQCDVHDVPLATNAATARCIVGGFWAV